MQLTKSKPTPMQSALADLGRQLAEGRAALDDAIRSVREMQRMSMPPRLERETIQHCRIAGMAAQRAWSTLGEAITAMGKTLIRG